MKKYKSFVKMDIPEKFDYDTEQLEEEKYEFKGRYNKSNPEFQEFCNDLRNDKKELKIIDIDRKDMVDVWAKNKF